MLFFCKHFLVVKLFTAPLFSDTKTGNWTWYMVPQLKWLFFEIFLRYDPKTMKSQYFKKEFDSLEMFTRIIAGTSKTNIIVIDFD